MSVYQNVRKYLVILSLFFVLVSGLHLGVLYFYEGSKTIPEKGGTVGIGILGSSVSMNPTLFRTDTTNDFVLRFLYRSLLRYDTDTRTMQGDLANCDLGRDFTEMKCYFKSGSKWSDGTEITKDDVLATYHFFEDFTGNKVLSAALTEVEISDEGDYIAFRTDKPNPDLLDIFTIPVLRKDMIDGFTNGTIKTENYVYSGPYVFDRRESDPARDIEKISIIPNANYSMSDVYIGKYVFRFFSDPTSLLAAKDSLNVIYPDKRVSDMSSSRFAQMSFNLPEDIMLFANTSKLNSVMRSVLLYQIGNIQFASLGKENGKIVKNPFGTDDSMAPSLTEKNLDVTMAGMGYFKKDSLLADAEKQVKESFAKKAKPLDTLSFFSSPTNKKVYVGGDKEDILLSGRVPEGVTEVYVNDYRLSGFSAGNKEFFYRAKTAIGTLKEGKNTYTLAFGYNGKKSVKETMTVEFIRDAAEREKRAAEVASAASVPLNADKLALDEAAEITKTKEKYAALDPKFYYDKSGKRLSVHLDYSTLSQEIVGMATEMKASLELIGVEAVLREMPSEEMEQAVKDGKKDYELLLTGVNLGLLGYNIFPFFHSGQAEKGFNFSKIKNVALDVQLEELKSKDLGKEGLKSVRDKTLAILRKEAVALTFYSPYTQYYLDRNIRSIRNVSALPYSSYLYDILEPAYIKEERLADFRGKTLFGMIEWIRAHLVF